jgi:RNAse (barnase) inhibitor barstar
MKFLSFAPKIKFILLFNLFLLSACEQTIQQPDKPKEVALGAISEGLKAFVNKGTLSMDNVNAYFAEKYAFDFDKEHRKFISQILPPRNKDASFRIQEIDLYNFQEILDYNGITPESTTYGYLASLSNIFNGGIYEDWEIYNLIHEMRADIADDFSMPDYERANLLHTWDVLITNYEGFLQISYAIFAGEIYSMARTQGWFRKAWRIFRSVVLVAAVGAMIGWFAGGPVGAIILAIIMGTVAITDAWANNYCHFAMQCDGGWRQSCSSGECTPYDDNP